MTLLKSSGGENPRDSLRFLDLLWERHRVHRSSMYQQDRDRKHVVTGLKRSHIWLLLMLLLVLRGCGPSKVGAAELSPAPIPLSPVVPAAVSQGSGEEREQQH